MLDSGMRYLLFFFATLFALPAAAIDMESIQLEPSEQTAVNEGDIIVNVWRDETRDDRAIDVLGVMNINASPSVIWNVMTDCTRTEAIVPRMKSCEVVEKGPDGSWDIRTQKTKVNFLISHTSRFRSDYDPYKSIKISRAGGDMKIQEGVWKLKPMADGLTQLIYRAASAPSFPVSKSKMIETSKERLPEVLANLRREAETDFKQVK